MPGFCWNTHLEKQKQTKTHTISFIVFESCHHHHENILVGITPKKQTPQSSHQRDFEISRGLKENIISRAA